MLNISNFFNHRIILYYEILKNKLQMTNNLKEYRKEATNSTFKKCRMR